MAKRWKKQEITYLKRYSEKRTVEELAVRFKTEEDEVRDKLRELGLAAKDWRDPDAPEGPDPMVEHLERGLAALHKGDPKSAHAEFEKVAEEALDPTLAGRADEYLKVCRGRLDGGDGEVQDAYLDAVMKRNAGALEEALEIASSGGRRSDDRFLYLAASLKAVSGDLAGAAEDLDRAIQMNQRHLFHARVDDDFDALRESEDYGALFEIE